MIVLRVTHTDLAGGALTFTDDEVVELEVFRPQIVVEQEAQGGNLSMIYVGEERHEFAILFNVFYQGTLPKLEQIRHLRDVFTLQPFLVEETTSYTVYWPQDPTMSERWVRGRRAAQWDKPILWREQRTSPCVSAGS